MSIEGRQSELLTTSVLVDFGGIDERHGWGPSSVLKCEVSNLTTGGEIGSKGGSSVGLLK